MHVTFLMLYHHPEKVSSYYLFNDIMESLRKDNHDVQVITPNPVRGISKIDRESYKKIKYENEFPNQNILRVQIPFDTNHSKITRALRSLFVSYFCAKKASKMKTDLMFVQSDPPVFYAYFATFFARRKKIPVVYCVQDLYPDILGKNKGFIYSILNFFQKKALKRASHVVVISDDIKARIESKGINPSHISVIHNWSFEAKSVSYDPYQRFNLSKDNFYVTYSGNIGYMQNMDIILGAIKLLSKHPNIRFLFVGDGVLRTKLEEMIQDEPNARFIPKVSVEEAEAIYAFSNINLITLKQGVIFGASPSKTATCIKAKRPIVACVDQNSSYARFIDESKIGLIVDPNDSNGLKNAILSIYSQEISFDEVSYTHALKTYKKAHNVDLYLKLFHRLAEKS